MKKKNNNAAVWKQLEKDGLANIKAVEIRTGAEDGVDHYVHTYIGSEQYARIGDENYRPTVEATIHYKDGTRRGRKATLFGVFSGNAKKACQVANAEAQEMWRAAKDKGIPVIMQTGNDRRVLPETKSAAYLQWEHQMQKKQLEDEYTESPKGKITLALLVVVLTALWVAGCYVLLAFMNWVGM